MFTRFGVLPRLCLRLRVAASVGHTLDELEYSVGTSKDKGM
jgi:hypothetical protein